MNIVVGSAFRNAAGHVVRYLEQVAMLQAHAGSEHHVRVSAVEGDSTDATLTSLATSSGVLGIDLQVVKCDHGLPWFGSVETFERMQALSKVGNAIFDSVREDDDVLVYVESDLVWNAHTVGSFIDMALRRDEGFDIFSPLIFAGDCFYDVWGYRMRGPGEEGPTRFGPFKPYHSGLNLEGLTEVSSVGSCLVMRAEVARRCRIRNNNCLVGWCDDARENGYRIGVHGGFRIQHL